MRHALGWRKAGANEAQKAAVLHFLDGADLTHLSGMFIECAKTLAGVSRSYR
jgi:hypothetical protein